MMSRIKSWATVPVVFWCLTVIAIIVWTAVPGYVAGWDLNVYKAAVLAIRAGRDPYVAGMDVQRVFHAHLAEHPTAPPPYTYVYSPLTLPALRALGRLPFWFCGSIYWTAYVAAMATVVWFGTQFIEQKEWKIFKYIVPAIVFFPGLLQYDVIFSGNIAFILYALIFAALLAGWRRDNWFYFYATVIAASCCKAPMLSLLVIPVLSARKQWIPALATGTVGVALFGIQPFVWPVLFRNYLKAVELQFSYNHDFSSSPAGLLADALYYKIPYQTTSVVFYSCYAALFFGILLYFSRKFVAGYFGLKEWVPVLMLGTILLNPRIMEYDVAPISLLMGLIVWRFFASRYALKATIVWTATLFAIANACAPTGWRTTECFVMIALFGGGCWTLFRRVRDVDAGRRLHLSNAGKSPMAVAIA